MHTLDKNKAKEILIKEFDYKEYEADTFLESFPEIHDELSSSVQKWIEDRTIEDVNVFGLTIKELMNVNKHENFLHAIQLLNRLYDIDEEKRTNMIRILRKPHAFA